MTRIVNTLMRDLEAMKERCDVLAKERTAVEQERDLLRSVLDQLQSSEARFQVMEVIKAARDWRSVRLRTDLVLAAEQRISDALDLLDQVLGK